MVDRQEKLYFYFSTFSLEKNMVGLLFYEDTSILLRVGALLFYFAFLLIKNSRVGCLKQGRSG